MHTTKYIFAGIMSAIIGTAHATGENIIAAKSYVDTQDALKQDLIDAEMMTISIPKMGVNQTVPRLVSYDDTNGLTGNTVGLIQSNTFGTYNYNDDRTWWWITNYNSVTGNNTVLTSGAVKNLALKLTSDIDTKQDKIPASGNSRNGSAYNTDVASNPLSWLNTAVKGLGVVTRTSTDGQVGERSIFEALDVPAYHDDKLTQTEKDIQDISIPTVGAMMSAISSGITAAAPTGTANTIANYDANGALGSGIATYDASGTYTAQTDAGKIATAAAVETRQKKKVCAGWPDGTTTYDAQHTDANCWLWTLPD